MRCGAIADITCFSFHPRKLLTTGEGGAITFNDQKYIQFFDIKLNHGSIFSDGKFDFVDFGYNYRLSELQAIMGIKQVYKLDMIIASRNTLRNIYMEKLTPLGFEIQSIEKDVIYNVQSLVFRVPKGVHRDTLIKVLKDVGIETTLGTYCLSGTSYYANKYHSIQPNAVSLEQETITFPCYDGVDVNYICQKVKECVLSLSC